MKKVYAQDKIVVKEKIQGEKAKENTDRTLRSSLEAVYYMQILGSQVLCNFINSI